MSSLLTITDPMPASAGDDSRGDRGPRTASRLAPVHPGEVLREEFLAPLGLSAGAVARAIGVPRTRIERLAAEQVELSADTALRLARYFGTSAGFWMNLQGRYALDRAEDAAAAALAGIKPLHKTS